MKKLFLFILFGCVLVSCIPRTDGGDYEIIRGSVSDEIGQPLQGIRISYYWTKEDLDEQWTNIYTDSREDGTYYLIDRSHQNAQNSRDFYLVATDPKAFYQSQTIQAKMTYNTTTNNADDRYAGIAEVNIIMIPRK